MTPNLDALAATGMRYTNAISNAPVCAPARTTIITGLYPPSTGAEHMRSLVRLPAGFRMFPQFLRDAGYYCTNNSKEDYNVEKPGGVWDESSKQGALEEPPQGPAVLCRVQSHDHARVANSQRDRRSGPAFTIRPKCACPPIIRTRRKCAATGPNTTTASR